MRLRSELATRYASCLPEFTLMTEGLDAPGLKEPGAPLNELA